MAATQVLAAPQGLSEFYGRRALRLLAAMRLAIAVSTASLLLLTDRQAFTDAPILLVVLGYLALSLTVFGLSRRPISPDRRWFLLAHIGDLATFAALMILTEGPASPFFLFLMLAVLSGTIQWGRAGAVMTAAAVIAIYCLSLFVADLADADMRRIGLRAVYLGASAGLLAYLGLRLQRLHQEVMRLAFHTAQSSGLSEEQEAVRRAAQVFENAEIVLLLDQGGQLREVRLRDGKLIQSLLPEGSYRTLVHPELDGADFLVKAQRSKPAMVLFWEGGQARHWAAGAALSEELGAAASSADALCTIIRSLGATGRLLVLGLRDATAEDLAIARVISTEIGLLLDRREMLLQASRAAALEQRVRLARNLHDGVLQVFTSLSLQIEKAIGDVVEAPRAAAELRRLQASIEAEQRELRGFIQQLRAEEGPPLNSTQTDIDALLGQLAGRLNRLWGIAVKAVVDPGLRGMPPALAYEICWLLSEAAANSARHGGASRLDFRLERRDGALRLTITDDGGGSAASEPEARRRTLNPRSLMDRIADLKGTVSIRSDRHGTELSISLPQQAAS